MNTQYALLSKPSNSIAIAHPERYVALSVLLLLTFALTACQKNETIPTTAERLKSVEQRQQTQPDFYVPRKVVDYMSDLKSMKENPAKLPPPVTEPPAAKVADAKPASVLAKSAAPATEPPVALPTKSATVTAPAPIVVASAAPTALPPPPREVASTVSVVSREQPEFPREAQRAGIMTGNVRAKLTINAAGGVSNVAIVEAKPSRVFDRSVTQALSRWKFNPGADGRIYETEITFKMEL